MAPLSAIGAWLLVAGTLAIAVEGVLAAIWATAIVRRTRRLSERLAAEQTLIVADIDRLRLALEETRRLWMPYGRVLRWLQHPLTAALLQSYARRRASAR